MIFIEYPKCSTCKKAKQFLDAKGLIYEDRNMAENTPSFEELQKWTKLSLRPLKTFFNTSGNLYKELDLKNKLLSMSEEEQLKLLSSNGMLIKRPLLIVDQQIFSGFREKEWEEFFKEKNL